MTDDEKQADLDRAVKAAENLLEAVRPGRLKDEYAADVKELRSSPHSGMQNLRKLQAKYREAGLSEEDLDISNKSKAPLDWRRG